MLASVLRFVVRERLVVLLLAAGLIAAGWQAAQVVPVDAIPNVGENQVIVFADWPGRSPRDVEDQVTYPLSVALLSVPGAESVRGKSMFGFSFLQVTFSDDTEFYWARTRVLERLGGVAPLLPEGVTPALGLMPRRWDRSCTTRSSRRLRDWISHNSARCRITLSSSNCRRSKGSVKSPASAALCVSTKWKWTRTAYDFMRLRSKT